MGRSKKSRTTQGAGRKSTASKPTICLAMIVKDEEKDIIRCLESVIPHIDYWVIFDTGSSDNTIQVIKDFMKANNKPGELHESEWKDFSTNRNEVLEVADKKADFTMCMDADDYLKVKGNIRDMVGPSHHKYLASFVMNDSMVFDRAFMFKNGHGIRYTGVLHEYLIAPPDMKVNLAKLSQVVVNASSSPLKRASTTQEKYANDAAVLLKDYERDPTNPRTVFYMAQSYRDAQMYDEAIKWYKKRIEMEGWDQEVYYSKLELAACSARNKSEDKDVMELYLDAWDYRPYRLEAIYNVAKYNRHKKRYRTAYALSAAAMGYFSQFGGKDNLFVNSSVENWLMMDEYCINAYMCNEVEVAYLNTKLLMESSQWDVVPKDEKERIEKNMSFYKEKYFSEKKK